MKNKTARIMAIILIMIALFSIAAHAAVPKPVDEINFLTPKPTMTFNNGTATCKVTLRSPGKSIDATLELWQGSTFIASWSDSNTSSLTLSGNATVTSGLPYTLTVSGTINGIAFTPVSVTKTP